MRTAATAQTLARPEPRKAAASGRRNPPDIAGAFGKLAELRRSLELDLVGEPAARGWLVRTLHEAGAVEGVSGEREIEGWLLEASRQAERGTAAGLAPPSSGGWPLAVVVRRAADTFSGSEDLALRRWSRRLRETLQARDDLRAAVVSAHVPFVERIARGLTRRPDRARDLAHEGILGIIDAIERFDPKRSTRFETYAAWWVRHHMLALLRRRDGFAGLPRGGGPPALVPYDDAAEAGGVGLLDGRDPDGSSTSAPGGLEARERLALLHGALACLEERERAVLEARYGLGGRGERPRPFRSVGRALSLSAERVRQIQKEALAKLRRLVAPGGPAPPRPRMET